MPRPFLGVLFTSRRPAHQAWERTKGGGRGRPRSRPSSLARCGDSEGKQVPQSILLLQLRAQTTLPGQTGVLLLAEAPNRRGSATPASHTVQVACGPSPAGHAACESTWQLQAVHPLGLSPTQGPLGIQPDASVRRDAQQSLLASKGQFVLGQMLWHWHGLGELRRLVLLWLEQNQAGRTPAPLSAPDFRLLLAQLSPCLLF